MYYVLVGQDEVKFLDDLVLEDKKKSLETSRNKHHAVSTVQTPYLEGLVGLCDCQHFVSMVDPAELTQWAQ